jgi:two-component system, chemotaxis family, response regulator Rcp1
MLIRRQAGDGLSGSSADRTMSSLDILIVEDSEAGARLLIEVLREINKNVRLHVVPDGVEAMAFLKYQERYLNAPRPSLILLDLGMPKMNGLEVLATVRQDPWLRTIPVIVLTSSQAEEDIAQSYLLMVSCYLTKPQEFQELEQMVKSPNDFWMTRVKFKRHEPVVK